MVYFTQYWAGKLSRYNDWLRAGRSGDRIPVGARFSALVQTGPGTHVAYRVFRGGKERPRSVADPSPLLVLWPRKSRFLPLFPLWAVQSVQSLSACTVQLYLYCPYGVYNLYRASVPVQYSYTSTPPMGCTACKDPQCLYKGELYFYLHKCWCSLCHGWEENCGFCIVIRYSKF